MKRARVVSFDLEGTLIDRSFSDHVWLTAIPTLYAESRGLSLEQAREIVLREYEEVGDERLEWYDIAYWFNRLGIRGDWRRLLEENSHLIRPYPEVPGVLERLSKRYTLIIVSNTAREFMEFQLRDIGRFFTHVFSATSDFREVKKSADFYLKICNILEVKPEEVVHVGDHLKFDFLTPRSVGIEAYYLDRSGERRGEFVVRDLEEFERKLETP